MEQKHSGLVNHNYVFEITTSLLGMYLVRKPNFLKVNIRSRHSWKPFNEGVLSGSVSFPVIDELF